MVNCVCVCLSSMYVIRLCVGEEAICLILGVGYLTLVFLKVVKKQERSLICFKIGSFVLMRINVFGLCVSLFLRVY